MGITESSLKTCVKPLQTCVSEVLGSFDCTMKSKCCENYKCLNFYYHCRTTQSDIISDTDDEVTTIYNTETPTPLSVNTDLN